MDLCADSCSSYGQVLWVGVQLQEVRGRVAAWPSLPNPVTIAKLCSEELAAHKEAPQAE